jgi:long-chain acyl-CoA synthetase
VHNHLVRELTRPRLRTPTENSAARYVFDNAQRDPGHAALRRPDGPNWVTVTSAEFAAAVTEVANGLLAAGVEVGDRVALMSKTSYEWTLLDFAVLSIGAVVVPIYETSSAEQLDWILTDSGAVALVIETAEHRALLEGITPAPPALRHVWQLSDTSDLEDLIADGRTVANTALPARLDATKPGDVASIIYTSGTTGRPKGCVLTHANLIAEVSEVVAALSSLFSPDNSTLLFLPLAHVFGRAIAFGAIASGTTLGHTADVTNLVDDLGEFKPTFVLAVPRVFEKVYNGARQRAEAQKKGAIFDRAERVAVAYSEALAAGGPPVALRLKHRIFDKLVYRKLRAALGGQCRAAISGGAPLGSRLGHFFRGAGVTIYEGYGLTESTAGVCVNREGSIKIGSVGQPIGGMSMVLAEDGELLMTGPMVFDRYWNNEEATSAVLTERDGRRWFHTGDLGAIDNDGFITITGRKKELIVTANGKNVAPAVLEDRVRAHWLVDQCLVVGDKMPYIAALITIDAEAWPIWLAKVGLPAEAAIADHLDNPMLLAELQHAVDDANLAVSHAEAIKKFTVLPTAWTEADGQLTPSMKLRRSVVLRSHLAEITGMYGRA